MSVATGGTMHSAYDVIVVGYGSAGAIAAIEASDAGASVLLLEKMKDPGGISICAGGRLRVAQSFESAFAYLRETNAGTTPLRAIVWAALDEAHRAAASAANGVRGVHADWLPHEVRGIRSQAATAPVAPHLFEHAVPSAVRARLRG